MSEEIDYSVPFDFLPSDEDAFDLTGQMGGDKDSHPITNNMPDKLNLDEFTSHSDAAHTEEDETHDTYDQDLITEGLVDSHNKYEPDEQRNNLSTDIKIDEVVNGDTTEMNSKIDTDANKIAIINFDDNWISQYENAKPILDEYQYKATFYIVCDYIDGNNRMTWQQIDNLQRDGHEIGSHTMNHENLDTISTAARYHEIVESKKCIEDKGFKVNSFSYPFNSGDDNQETLDLVADNYDFARTAGGSSDDDSIGKHEDYERFTIIGWSHDAERKKHNYSDLQMLDAFKDYINKVERAGPTSNGNIPIIIYHNINDVKGVYNTSTDLFNSEMQYLYDNGFKVVTMSEVFGQNSYE